MNLEELLIRAEKHVRFLMFKKRETVYPTWFLFNGQEVRKLVTPWQNERERQVWKIFIRAIIEREKILAYGFVSEVWMATASKEEYESGKTMVEPRHRPDRKEMVLAFATDGKAQLNRSWKIVRNWQEQITGLEPKDNKMKKRLLVLAFFFLSTLSMQAQNWYKVYFSSKGTGPANVIVEALNDAGAREQVKARYPGAYSLSVIQIPKPEIIVERPQ